MFRRNLLLILFCSFGLTTVSFASYVDHINSNDNKKHFISVNGGFCGDDHIYFLDRGFSVGYIINKYQSIEMGLNVLAGGRGGGEVLFGVPIGLKFHLPIDNSIGLYSKIGSNILRQSDNNHKIYVLAYGEVGLEIPLLSSFAVDYTYQRYLSTVGIDAEIAVKFLYKF